ncbi:MAG: UPF0179 family protein [Methanomassiliicoccales archaeon]
MVTITLIGEHQAKQGEEFVYLGPLTDCRDCRLKTVCFNLSPGNRYRVIGTRDIHHDCRMHEDGVRVVEVETIPIRCAVKRRYALEGSTVKLDCVKCGRVGCQNFQLCHPPGVAESSKRKVTAVKRELDCPAELRMVEVEVE